MYVAVYEAAKNPFKTKQCKVWQSLVGIDDALTTEQYTSYGIHAELSTKPTHLHLQSVPTFFIIL